MKRPVIEDNKVYAIIDEFCHMTGECQSKGELIEVKITAYTGGGLDYASRPFLAISQVISALDKNLPAKDKHQLMRELGLMCKEDVLQAYSSRNGIEYSVEKKTDHPIKFRAYDTCAKAVGEV